ncbi:MAG TPA: hypothetical protein VMJ70_11345 [Candidatus Sulfotelmatobacter sp.]|nr:hypothetical protein [Candidatus Sulfotelmatobacter sp.]
MHFKQFYGGGLAHASCLIGDAGVAAAHDGLDAALQAHAARVGEAVAARG